MANFYSDFQTLPFIQSHPFIDPISDCAELNNACDLQISQTFFPFSSENCPLFQDSPKNLLENLTNTFHRNNQNQVLNSQPCDAAEDEHCSNESNKRKSVVLSESSLSWHSPSQSAITKESKRQHNSRKGKRLKKSEEDEEKPKEVVHVRARRGQATDSHSLAERVRRGKINERLKCLQDIVPGCYKAMGMATMLDEIINYVQSLQSQVEFLSLNLTAASEFYDFNSETDDLPTMQRAKAHEAIDTGRQMKNENSVFGGFHSSWP